MNRRFHEACRRPIEAPEDIKTLFGAIQSQRPIDTDAQWLKEVVLRILGTMYTVSGEVIDFPLPPPLPVPLQTVGQSGPAPLDPAHFLAPQMDSTEKSSPPPEPKSVSDLPDATTAIVTKLSQMSAASLIGLIKNENLGSLVLNALVEKNERRTVVTAATQRLLQLKKSEPASPEEPKPASPEEPKPASPEESKPADPSSGSWNN